MEIALSLALPRDELSVPVARRIVDASLRSVGVTEDCLADVSLALTEACTNVLKHSGDGDEYEVRCELDDACCSIVVTDVGRGFDFTALSSEGAAADSERGRGVQLMHALVDSIRFESIPADGNVVRMTKQLEYGENSLLDRAVSRGG